MAASGSEVTGAKIGHIHLLRQDLRQDSGGQDCDVRRISQAQPETHLMLATQCIISSIHEGDGDAVKASSEWKDQWW